MLYRDIKTLKKKVEKILEDFPETRNSDTLLTVTLWEQFYNHLLTRDQNNIKYISLKNVLEVPTQDSISRVRQKIQNEDKLYLPTSWEVARQRKILEDEWRVALGYPVKSNGGKPSWVPPSYEKAYNPTE